MTIRVGGKVELPCTSEPICYQEWPEFTALDYSKRIDKLLSVLDDDFTHMVFYGDREHFSNIEYFTGYDPRFEEALLIIGRENDRPMLIVGNEGWSYADKVKYPIVKRKYTPFSLPNQPYDPDVSLTALLLEAGIAPGAKVALFGWKMFPDGAEFEKPWYDVPYYLVKQLFDIVGETQVCTMNHVMIDSGCGLRTCLDSKELVLAEISGTRTSRAVHRALARLHIGINELEASAGLQIDGYPLSMHPNTNFGDNIFYGLASPEPNTCLHEGDIACVGMSYRRSLCHKVGIYTKDYASIPVETKQVYEKYFEAICSWYETVRIGTTGGEVHSAVERVVDDLEEFGIGLNLGHAIHTEEWTSSPFFENSPIMLRSGMMLQCDFSVSLPVRGIAVHAEDGVVLADKSMREAIRSIAPSSYRRMCQRRSFLREVLGINVADEVLPTSDMPAVVFPCMADLTHVYVKCQ